jgi:acyl-CoA thioester hydrolase
MAGSWPHTARIVVRYHECDMQKVVFNAHYMTYCDEAMGSWLIETIGAYGDDHIDWMLVRAELDWKSSATFGDVIDIDLGVERWGTTSFVTRFRGHVGERPLFEARITYVCVHPRTTTKMEVPPDVRAVLGLAPEPG